MIARLGPCLLLLLATGWPAACAGSERMVLDGRHRLFLDDRVCQDVKGMKLVHGSPSKHSGNPIIRNEYPWEKHVVDCYGTALRDSRTGEFRMWYFAIDGGQCHMAYATSRDGVNWTKRLDLGTVPFQGTSRTNLLLGPTGDWPYLVVHDCNEPDPGKRYKGTYWQLNRPTPEHYGNATMFSPDGIHWTSQDHAARTQLSHAYSVAYDESILRYVAFGQHRHSPRSISRQESKDFVAWTTKRQVLKPNEKDPPGTEFYGMTAHRESDGYVGFLWVFHARPDDPLPRLVGPIDVELVWSPDGITWRRPFQGQTFLALGPDGSWDDGMLFTSNAPVAAGDKLMIYYSAWNIPHGNPDELDSNCMIGLATLRLDGYAYLEPEARSGSVTTPVLTVRGGRLLLNADAKGGDVRVEVLDERGRVLPGYSAADCTPIRYDSIRHAVTWSGGGRLPVSSRPISLRFVAEKAKLYSFWVEP